MCYYFSHLSNGIYAPAIQNSTNTFFWMCYTQITKGFYTVTTTKTITTSSTVTIPLVLLLLLFLFLLIKILLPY